MNPNVIVAILSMITGVVWIVNAITMNGIVDKIICSIVSLAFVTASIVLFLKRKDNYD
jgi:hypothetical protein